MSGATDSDRWGGVAISSSTLESDQSDSIHNLIKQMR